MAWDTTYNNAATLTGSVTPNMTPPSGGGAWIENGESAEETITNRPHQAIALNCDLMQGVLSADKAIPQVGSLTGHSGNTIVIDPTGGAHDLDALFSPTGALYVGSAPKYTGASQELIDNLFQVLDSDYNEVMVDGVEVKVQSIGGTTFGSGFYSGGAVTLTLNKTLPAGNYRIGYARDGTLGDLPDDALISMEIRGLHEAAGESAKISWVVCAPAGGVGDYIGAGAVEAAITASEKRIFIKSGTYTMSAGLSVPSDSYIVGEARDTTKIQSNSTTNDIDLNSGCYVQGLTFENLNPGTGATVQVDSSVLRNCDVVGFLLLVRGTPTEPALVDNVVAPNIYFYYIGAAVYADVTNCVFTGTSLYWTLQIDVALTSSNDIWVTFTNCVFTGVDGRQIFTYDDNASGFVHATFSGCKFIANNSGTNEAINGTLDGVESFMNFVGCEFINNVASTSTEHVWKFYTNNTDYLKRPISLTDCVFRDAVTECDTCGLLYMAGVNVSNVYIDRTGYSTTASSQDASNDFVYATKCTIDSFRVHLEMHASALANSGATALLNFQKGCDVSNLMVEGVERAWNIPIVALAADSSSAAHLKNFDINFNGSGGAWSNTTTAALLATSGSGGCFVNGVSCIIPGSWLGTVNTLIELDALGSFTDSYLSSGNNTGNGVLTMIEITSTHCQVRNNTILHTNKGADGTADYSGITFASTAHYSAAIGNTIIMTGQTFNNVNVVSGITANSSCTYGRILDNFIQADVKAVLGDENILIGVYPGDLAASLGDKECGGFNVANNTLQSTSSEAPDIYYGSPAPPAVPLNDATNLIIYTT